MTHPKAATSLRYGSGGAHAEPGVLASHRRALTLSFDLAVPGGTDSRRLVKVPYARPASYVTRYVGSGLMFFIGQG